MTWNDHDHRGEYAEARHDHFGDYAEPRHDHHDLERADEAAQKDIRDLRAQVRELRAELDAALERIGDLEKQTPQARQLQLEADLAAADLAGSGYRPDDYGPPVGADHHGRDCKCPHCLDDPGDEPGITVVFEFADDDQVGAPDPAGLNTPRMVSRTYWPGAVCEVVTDDMCGAAAVARITSRATGDHLWACRPHAENMLRADPGDAYISWAKSTETSGHHGHGHAPAVCECNGGPPCDCPDCDHPDCIYQGPDQPEPEEYDPGPEADDEGGMSEYRHTVPDDYQRGQS